MYIRMKPTLPVSFYLTFFCTFTHKTIVVYLFTNAVQVTRVFPFTHHQAGVLHGQRQTQQPRADVPLQQVNERLTETARAQRE